MQDIDFMAFSEPDEYVKRKAVLQNVVNHIEELFEKRLPINKFTSLTRVGGEYFKFKCVTLTARNEEEGCIEGVQAPTYTMKYFINKFEPFGADHPVVCTVTLKLSIMKPEHIRLLVPNKIITINNRYGASLTVFDEVDEEKCYALGIQFEFDCFVPLLELDGTTIRWDKDPAMYISNLMHKSVEIFPDYIFQNSDLYITTDTAALLEFDTEMWNIIQAFITHLNYKHIRNEFLDKE